MDNLHECAKCQTPISYGNRYKEHGLWYCGKCFRELDPEYYERHREDDRLSKGRRGERSDD